MTSSASTRRTRWAGRSSLPGLVKIIGRLLPRQLSDELALALVELKAKGVKVGIAAAFFVVALVFMLFLVIALIVAAIMGLATIMAPWLAALIVAAFCLIVVGIGALIGVSRFKKTLPLLPAESIHGLKYDLGVLREGRGFNPATLDDKRVKPAKPAEEKETAPKPPAPSHDELVRRTSERRDHMASVRDSLGTQLDFKTRATAWYRQTKTAVIDRLDEVRTQRAYAASHRQAGAGSLQDRWKPLLVLTASVAVIGVLLRRLVRN